jgi:serine/threonine protein kinase
MALTPGTRIGTFQITGRLGAGGMGEVYRARDTTLGREVAIKVLPDTFARDADRLARFEREAQVLASLNHQNIGTIYGVQNELLEGNPMRALVLELIEGPTLADLLATGALPLEQSISLARQMASALDAAHERGIVHRDLKPANIKVRSDGTAKILDFGIAKAGVIAVISPAAINDAATASLQSTRAGVILGTPGFMSPEQARGQEVDKRTDIWAFGCVLFAMLTGRTPFAGDTLSDAIAATLSSEPDWPALPPDTPESIHRLLQRCLQRDLRRRLRDIGDACAELDEPMQPRQRTAVASVGSPAPRSVSFQRLTDSLGMNESPAISPDGRMVAFVAPVEGRRQIWVRLLAGGAPLRVTHDEGDHEHPRWTPDGTSIIYFATPEEFQDTGTLWEVAALGGAARPLISSAGGGDVSHDGRRIVFFRVHSDHPELVSYSRDSGAIERVAHGPRGCSCDVPRWSPDDRWIVFHARGLGRFDEQFHVVPASGGRDPQPVARAAALKGASWLPDSSGIVYSSSTGSTLIYPPTFNLRRVGRDGTGDHAITFGDISYTEPDVSKSGTILTTCTRAQSDIWRFPVSGSPTENTRAAVRVTRQSGQVQTPSVSPNGKEVVYLSDSGGHANLWITRTAGTGIPRQITFERDPMTTIGVPVWSPGENRIAFIVSRDRIAIWTVNSDGRGLSETVARGIAPCWSPDGTWLYYSPMDDNEEWRIEKVPAAGGAAMVIRTDPDCHAPAAGRDALYFATRLQRTVARWDWEFRRASPEDGASQVLTRVAGSRMPVSRLFASTVLSPDGRQLALPIAEGATCNICVLSVEGGGSFTPLTDFGERPTIIAREVSWAPDGGSIYAAVAEIQGDIVALDGLI